MTGADTRLVSESGPVVYLVVGVPGRGFADQGERGGARRRLASRMAESTSCVAAMKSVAWSLA